MKRQLCQFKYSVVLCKPSKQECQRDSADMSTSKDRQILNSIVNPLLPIGEAVFDPEEEENTVDNLVEEESEASLLSKSLEKEASGGGD